VRWRLAHAFCVSISFLFPFFFFFFFIVFYFWAGVSPVRFSLFGASLGSGYLNEGSGSRESWATGHF
jgi:hypothetical protein